MNTIRFSADARSIPCWQDVVAGIEHALSSEPETDALIASPTLSARSTGFEVRVRRGDRIVRGKVAFPRSPIDVFPTLEETSQRVRATESVVRRLVRSVRA